MVAIAAVCAAAGAVSSAAAATEIQLNQFMIKTPKGRQPVTLYIDTPSRSASTEACRYAPRIRDSVLGELNRAPVKLTAQGGVDLKQLHFRLLPVVIGSLPRDHVVGIRLVDGVPRLSSFAAKSLARLGCTATD